MTENNNTKYDKKYTEPTSISNENFSFVNENKNVQDKSRIQNTAETQNSDYEDFEKLLQSPVESHFALTPVTNSETSSPANGFTNQDCTDLLQQELDKLEEQQQVLQVEKVEKSQEITVGLELVTTVSVDGLLSPTDEQVNMFSRNSRNRDDVVEIGAIGDNCNIQGIQSTNSGEVSRINFFRVCLHIPN